MRLLCHFSFDSCKEVFLLFRLLFFWLFFLYFIFLFIVRFFFLFFALFFTLFFSFWFFFLFINCFRLFTQPSFRRSYWTIRVPINLFLLFRLLFLDSFFLCYLLFSFSKLLFHLLILFFPFSNFFNLNLFKNF